MGYGTGSRAACTHWGCGWCLLSHWPLQQAWHLDHKVCKWRIANIVKAWKASSELKSTSTAVLRKACIVLQFFQGDMADVQGPCIKLVCGSHAWWSDIEQPKFWTETRPQMSYNEYFLKLKHSHVLCSVDGGRYKLTPKMPVRLRPADVIEFGCHPEVCFLQFSESLQNVDVSANEQ